MAYAALALRAAGHGGEPGAEHDRAKPLEDLRPDDRIGNVGLVLQRHEDDAARRARSLADEDQPGDGDAAAVLYGAEGLAPDDCLRGEPVAQERDRMRLQRQAEK